MMQFALVEVEITRIKHRAQHFVRNIISNAASKVRIIFRSAPCIFGFPPMPVPRFTISAVEARRRHLQQAGREVVVKKLAAGRAGLSSNEAKFTPTTWSSLPPPQANTTHCHTVTLRWHRYLPLLNHFCLLESVGPGPIIAQ